MKRVTLSVCAAVFAAFLAAGNPAQAQTPAPRLGNDDCIKCHTVQPADVAQAGGKHKTVGCADCHTGHRPSSKNNIPECSNCHSGKPHFQLQGCLGCHTNPHTPKKITISGKVTDPCLTCHTEQIKQLRENKSKHTALFCNTCHATHPSVPQCTQCHKPHSAAMGPGDCKKCHKAHMPLALNYGSDVPNTDCGACHKKALDLLNASQAKHKA
ncbi:MAG TPA: cytochrome C, partial [Verrucomicrobiae bacterium]|nr:cytochrome C [Verrucomicrobiae bacterium]